MAVNNENEKWEFKGYEKMADNTQSWSELPNSAKKIQWCVTEKGKKIM